ncbi:hypothetical protein ACFU51_16350 [Streptomyces sp. NPDC057430]|uniref:hypothetical protein n=1 Tax=Streptomyces sp. NPDC057430 TaxID=3346131 RepID=UPI00367DBEB6
MALTVPGAGGRGLDGWDGRRLGRLDGRRLDGEGGPGGTGGWTAKAGPGGGRGGGEETVAAEVPGGRVEFVGVGLRVRHMCLP